MRKVFRCAAGILLILFSTIINIGKASALGLDDAGIEYIRTEWANRVILTMTSINPEEKTAKFIFNHQPKDEFFEEFEFPPILIKNLWIAGPGNLGYLMDIATIGLAPEVAELVDKDVFYNVTEVDDMVEFELSLGDVPVIGDFDERIYWAMTTYNSGFSAGIFDFGSCLRSDEYIPGMECVATRDDETGYRYIPINVNKEEKIDEKSSIIQTTNDETEDYPEEIRIDQKMEDYILEDVADSIDELIVVSIEEEKDAIENDFSDADIVEIPLAGNTMLTKHQNIDDFPWWLTVLLVIAGAVILWLFWPKRTKKAQKHPKM